MYVKASEPELVKIRPRIEDDDGMINRFQTMDKYGTINITWNLVCFDCQYESSGLGVSEDFSKGENMVVVSATGENGFRDETWKVKNADGAGDAFSRSSIVGKVTKSLDNGEKTAAATDRMRKKCDSIVLDYQTVYVWHQNAFDRDPVMGRDGLILQGGTDSQEKGISSAW